MTLLLITLAALLTLRLNGKPYGSQQLPSALQPIKIETSPTRQRREFGNDLHRERR